MRMSTCTFVLVEFNIEDIKELKRITQLELTGTLDPDGVKAFVEAPWQNHFIGIRKNSSMRAPYNGCSLRGVIYGGWQATYENTLVIQFNGLRVPDSHYIEMRNLPYPHGSS